jgi:sec-independent protein translocase protein TatA
LTLSVFGAKKLAEIGKGIGQGIKEFKESLSGTNEEERPVPFKQIEVENE